MKSDKGIKDKSLEWLKNNMVMFRFVQTMGFWQILVTISLSLLIFLPLAIIYCKDAKNGIYAIIPMISLIVASLGYYINKIDKSRGEARISIYAPETENEAETALNTALNASGSYLVDSSLVNLSILSDSIANRQRSMSAIFINVFNDSKNSKMTIKIKTTLKSGVVSEHKTINPGSNISLMLSPGTNLSIRYFNHKKYCKTEGMVIND